MSVQSLVALLTLCICSFLDQSSIDQLLALHRPVHSRVYAEHCTLLPNPDQAHLQLLPVGRAVRLRCQFAVDGGTGVQAVNVLAHLHRVAFQLLLCAGLYRGCRSSFAVHQQGAQVCLSLMAFRFLMMAFKCA